MSLLFFEFLGTTELMVILVAALVLFGPRKLPEISRQIGKGLAEFRKASDDFRQTWEKEVQHEFTLKDGEMNGAIIPEEKRVTENTIGRGQALTGQIDVDPSAAADFNATPIESETSIKAPTQPEIIPEPTQKRDWL
jgi:TatA/E family protein of Tat protein translocase